MTELLVDRPAARGPVGRPLGTRPSRWGERAIKAALFLCAMLSVATTFDIVLALLQPTIEVFRSVSSVDFLTGREWARLF